MEQEFPKPTFERIFMPINRKLLEEANAKGNDPIAIENLAILNHARDVGLWNGKVKVFEFGGPGLKGTPYEHNKVLVGAMVDFYIAQHGQIFIGTDISSFSVDLMRNRFYMNKIDNYRYLPDGLHRWTNKSMEHPPGFNC